MNPRALVNAAVALGICALVYATWNHAHGAALHVTATVLPPPVHVPGGIMIEGELAECRIEIVGDVLEVTC